MEHQHARPRDEGASAVEYAILVTLIAVAVIVAVVAMGREVKSDFECTENAIYAAPYGCDQG